MTMTGSNIDTLCARLIVLERRVIKLLSQTQKVRDEIVDMANAMAQMFPGSKETPES